MDAVERLSPEDLGVPSLSASEHLQRYEWAASAVEGLHVLDLACGIGYGSAILAGSAASVVGVDSSEAAIETARHLYGEESVRFEVGDAVEHLRRMPRDAYDAIVCFEGLEHLARLDEAVGYLTEFCAAGGRLLASVPNSATFGEVNEFHLTDFDLDSARALFSRFDGARLLTQVLAEGTAILDFGDPRDPADPPEAVRLWMRNRAEVGYANNFLVSVNVPEAVLRGSEARLRFAVAPYYNRHLRNLEGAYHGLLDTNRALGRQLAEIRAALAGNQPPLSALRHGRASGAYAVAKLARDRDMLAQELEETRARAADLANQIAEAGRYAADTEARAVVAEEYARSLEVDRGLAWDRYRALRRRKIVRLALALRRLIPR